MNFSRIFVDFLSLFYRITVNFFVCVILTRINIEIYVYKVFLWFFYGENVLQLNEGNGWMDKMMGRLCEL